MNKNYRTIFLLLFVFTSLFSLTPVYAATGVNKQINFQGKLTNADGTNVADNTYSVVFTLYDASSGGTNLWTETQSVTTSAGSFQVALGSVTSLGGVNFNADTIYLGIKVGADSEMTPRIRFAAVPYALNADKLNGVTATQSAIGFTLTGGTSTAKTLTLTESLTLGSTITPTNAGALTIQSNGANGLTFDTGGAASLSIGGTNANAVSISKAGTVTTINGGLTVTSGQNFVFNSDTFTDLTGNGLSVSSNALGINLTSSGTTGLTTSNSGLEVSSAGLTLLKGCADGQLLEYTDAGGWACANDDSGGGSGGSSNWTLGTSTGTLRPNNNTLDLLIGGTSTASAKFGILNVNSGTPTASVSAGAIGASYLAANGILGTTNKQTLTLGSTSTGNVLLAPGGTTVLAAFANGNVGIGTTTPDTNLTVIKDSTALGTGTIGNYGFNVGQSGGGLALGDFGVFKAIQSFGNTPLILNPAASNVGIGSTTIPTAKLQISGTGTLLSAQNANSSFYTDALGVSIDRDSSVCGSEYKLINQGTGYWKMRNSTNGCSNLGSLYFINQNNAEMLSLSQTGTLGLNTGTANPLATFDVRGNSGTTPVASVSGNTSFASMVVNNSSNGDIFTASSGGTTRFRIANNGSVLYQGDTLAAMGSGGTTTNSSAVTNMIGDQGSMIPNSGFESALSGITFADGWTVAASQSASATRDTVDQAKGTASVKILTSNNSTAIYSTCIPLAVKLTTYNLAWYAKMNNTARINTVRGYLDAYTSKANCQSNTSPSYSAPIGAAFAVNTNWQSFSGTTTTAAFAANSTWARVHFFIANGSASQTQVNIDGVRLVQSSLTQGVDYAENYPVDVTNIPQPGDVVSLKASDSATVVVPASKPMDQSMVGVVSTQPGHVLDDDNVPDPKVPVALAGRVPVKISTKNGPIHIGDYLTSSDIPGVAVKAIAAGPVLGTAMENYTEPNADQIGSVVMFIKNTYYQGASPVDTGLTLLGGSNNSVLMQLANALKDTSSVTELATEGLNYLASGKSLILPREELTAIVATESAMRIASTSASPQTLGIETLSSLSIDGPATISGSLRVKGNGLIEGVFNVVDTLTANSLIVSKVADFFGRAIFHNDVAFQGRPTFNNDTAGFAIIKKGTDRIAVTFEKTYEQTPVVSATINLEQHETALDEQKDKAMELTEQQLLAHDIRYLVTRTTAKGFVIVLNNPATEDIRFSWTALAIEKPATFDDSKKSSIMISPSVLGSESAERENK